MPAQSNADGLRDRNFRQIKSVKAGDVGLVRRGHGFLRLDDLEIVGDAGPETVLRLDQRLVGEVDVTLGHPHEFR